MSAAIPMTGDVANLIGSAAQHVENRSLLLDKFVFHKSWGLHEIKANDAHRWSLLRISENGGSEISREAKARKDEADRLQRKGLNPDKVERLRVEAKLAEDLASPPNRSKELAYLRASHTRRFIGLFRSAYGDRAAITIGQLEGRLAINLADSLIQNAGICLDRLFGLPYIPGSAVKGVCRHAALEELKVAKGTERESLFNQFRSVFGTADNDFTKGDLKPFHHLLGQRSVDQKGSVSFLPAYPVNDARIVVDLTNVHYPDYYRTGRMDDLSMENPRPNPFPTVEIGAQFAFCLVLNGILPDSSLLAVANRWLEVALTIRGLGAKTAAGYGWFSLQPKVLNKLFAEADAEKQIAIEREQASAMEPSSEVSELFASMSDQQLAGVLNKYAFESRFWPKDSTLLFELTLFEFIKSGKPSLGETKNGSKAMSNLAQKLNRPHP